MNCPIGMNKTLDLLYANIKEAYSCTATPPLGRSDHNLVHLLPCNEPLMKRQSPTIKAVREWLEETSAAMQVCLEMLEMKC